VRSIKALHGEWKFDEINFDYPSLPQYAMFWLGKAILAVGQTDKEVLIASRVLSAVLAGLTIVLTYILTRRAGGGIHVAGLSGLLLLCVSEVTHNGRFAHNDTYVTFFTTLTVLFLVEYHNRSHKSWLYAAFITVGMAATSKYIGGILLIVPVSIYLALQGNNLKNNLFAIAETLFVGGALTFLGYALGTPKSMRWMSYYFKRVYAALRWQVSYGRQPDSIPGFSANTGSGRWAGHCPVPAPACTPVGSLPDPAGISPRNHEPKFPDQHLRHPAAGNFRPRSSDAGILQLPASLLPDPHAFAGCPGGFFYRNYLFTGPPKQIFCFSHPGMAGVTFIILFSWHVASVMLLFE
jgi:hypothetical protein